MNNEEREALIERANGWLQNPPDDADEYDIEDVAQILARDKISDRGIQALISLIKGFRQVITLNEGEVKQVAQAQIALLEVFQQYPNLSIPRDKSAENINAALVKAAKALKRDA